MAPLAQRLASARAHRRRAADRRDAAIEAALGTRYTVDTLAALRRRFPRVRFVWLMGADNLEQLPRWRRWQEIARDCPSPCCRGPATITAALAGQAARRLRRARRRPARRAVLAAPTPPAWVFLPVPQHAASATAIRAAATGVSDHRPKPPATRRLARASHAAPPRSARRLPPPQAGLPAADAARHAAQEDDRRRPASRRAARDGRHGRAVRLDQLQAVIVGSLEDDKAENDRDARSGRARRRSPTAW